MKQKYCSNKCEYFDCIHIKDGIYKYRCLNLLVRRKNGNYRLLNHSMLLRRKLPEWCPYEKI